MTVQKKKLNIVCKTQRRERRQKNVDSFVCAFADFAVSADEEKNELIIQFNVHI
jgi:hypothetical protein